MIIKGDLILDDSNIESLGDLEEIKGSLYLRNCNNLKHFGNLKFIERLFFSNCSKIHFLPINLEIKEIIGLNKPLSFLENWKGINKLESISLSFLSRNFNFNSIPNFMVNHINKLDLNNSFKFIKGEIDNLNLEDFPENYKCYDFLIANIFKVLVDRYKNDEQIKISITKRGIEMEINNHLTKSNNIILNGYYGEITSICEYDIKNKYADFYVITDKLKSKDNKPKLKNLSLRNIEFHTMEFIYDKFDIMDIFHLAEINGEDWYIK